MKAPGTSDDHQTHTVPGTSAGERLDAVAARLFADFSRSRLQRWITTGALLVDGAERRPKDRLIGGEQLTLATSAVDSPGSWQETWDDGAVPVHAEPMSLTILHSDESIHVINKSAGLVMHPAPGHRTGTLMNGLLHHDPALAAVPRAGIVHRLDRDTTGLCVIARTLQAHAHLVDQLQSRTMKREYLAVALGEPPASGCIDEPMARHPRDRKRMAVVAGGKPARTHFAVVQRFAGCALLRVRLDTGRTHQIRVHLTHAGFPLLGDPVYRQNGSDRHLSTWAREAQATLGRQALHATRLTLMHPRENVPRQFDCALPEDMQVVLEGLGV